TLELYIKNPELPFNDFPHTNSWTEAILLESLGIDILYAPHIREQKLQICCGNPFYSFCVTSVCPIWNINDLIYDSSVADIIAEFMQNCAEIFRVQCPARKLQVIIHSRYIPALDKAMDSVYQCTLLEQRG